ncbi:MAG: tryptophan 7-halogenase [Colwelliaceae bacterium]|nr:tryptophan 7-halogenase [Colwelliaceae bacterium]
MMPFKVAIIGGGTSGWLSAAYLSKRLKLPNKQSIEITLIESSEIGTIGVGEATIPGIRQTFSELGLDEKLFMKSCSATFKQAIKFVDWNKPSEQDKSHYYYHNFSEPLKAGPEIYAPYWILNKENIGRDYAYSATIQSQLCDLNLAPKRLNDKDFEGPMHYAYHFDAGKLTKLLSSEGKSNGVKHLIGNVTETILAEDGAIEKLLTKEHGELVADLYIDCTGFSAKLIEKSLGSEFTSINDMLFVDRAVTAMVDYEDDEEIATTTVSTAQESGWIWDIALSSRRGTGYVYSSKYSSKERAEEVLRNYLGDKANVSVRHLDMRVGYREKQWVKNCVAIGLSGGFVEPLESTGIYLVEIALRTLINLFPWQNNHLANADQFNKLMTSQFLGAIDFIKLHYALSNRDDSPFWRDNVDENTFPETLKTFLARCENKVPNVFDLPVGPQCFNIFSYYSVLYGMNHLPDIDHMRDLYKFHEKANILPKEIDNILERAKKELPNHKSLIKKINANM